MRPSVFLIPPVLIATLACGSSRLSEREAAKDIRQDYPVAVVLRVPPMGKATSGTKEFLRLTTLKEAFTKNGWFRVDQRSEAGSEVFTFNPTPSLPSTVQATAKGWAIPAAQASFEKVLRIETRGSRARVTYQIKLEKPTAQFALFQAANPDVKIGDTKERHAMYKKERRDWVLQDTDEVLRKEP